MRNQKGQEYYAFKLEQIRSRYLLDTRRLATQHTDFFFDATEDLYLEGALKP